MTGLESAKRAVSESSSLSKRGDNKQALRVLDDSIRTALNDKDATSVRVLCRHAAVICDSGGDLALAKHYYELLLNLDAGDKATLYALADACFRLGDGDAAQRHAAKCYELSKRSGTEQDRTLVELISGRWPNLAGK